MQRKIEFDLDKHCKRALWTILKRSQHIKLLKMRYQNQICKQYDIIQTEKLYIDIGIVRLRHLNQLRYLELCDEQIEHLTQQVQSH